MGQDLDGLQGTWNIVSMEMDGQKSSGGSARIVVRGDRFVTTGMGAIYEGALAVDQTTAPKSFELHFEAGPEKGNTSFGIYELDGDTWKICLGLTGKTRPTKFVSAPGTGHALEILKRERNGAKKQLPAFDENAEPVAELEGDWFMVSCRQDGQPMDPRFVGAAKREFRGNTTTLTVGGRAVVKSRFTADSIGKTIEYADLRQHGIYQVTGDRLQTCLVPEGDTRPADFTASPGDGRLVSEWSRKKR